jgi:uncharacterized membrane protein YuzA (DUF378 family)
MPITHTDRSHPYAAAPISSTERTLDVVAIALLIVGGLNWGLVGLFNFDLVAALFGAGSALSRVVYVLVGIAALYGIVTATHLARRRVDAA